jgi:hypothetical protein
MQRLGAANVSSVAILALLPAELLASGVRGARLLTTVSPPGGGAVGNVVAAAAR